jgi:hypothetical protein
MAYVNGEWVEDNDPFKNPVTNSAQNTEGVQLQGAGSAGASQSAQTAPAPAYGNVRDQSSVDYGNGVTGKKGADGQWYYPWRAQGYQDVLSDQDVKDQQAVTAYRANGGKVAEDDRGALAQMTGQAPTGSAPKFQNTSPTFDDPTQRLVEDSALARYQHLQNPDPNSGTAMYEQYARDLVNALKQPVYSPQDESILKGGALDAMTQERDQTKQRWLEELSRRGMSPSSGPALQGLLEIDNHYNQARTQVEAQFAQNAIQQTRDQRFQTADVLSKLSQSEEGRLSDAVNYAKMPYGLTQDAFGRNLQLTSAAGNPAANLSSLLSVYQTLANNNRLNSLDRQNGLESIFQSLAELF